MPSILSEPTYVGQDVKILMTATLSDGTTGASPTSVQFRVRTPSGTVTTYVSGVDSNVGTVTAGKVYSCQFDCSEAGTWWIRGESLDGAVILGVNEISFQVSPSHVI